MDKNLSKLIMFPLLLVLVFVAWFLGLYLPMSHQADRLSTQIIQAEAKAKEIVPQAKIDILKTNIDTLMLYLDQRNSQLYPEEGILQIGKVFDELGKKTGLKLVQITPDYQILTNMANAPEEIIVLPLVCEYEGVFGELTSFIDSISEFPFNYQIQFFTVKHHEEIKGTLLISLQGRIIVQKAKDRTKIDKKEVSVAGNI